MNPATEPIFHTIKRHEVYDAYLATFAASCSDAIGGG